MFLVSSPSPRHRMVRLLLLFPCNRHWTNVDLMLAHTLVLRANIKSILGQRLVFTFTTVLRLYNKNALYLLQLIQKNVTICRSFPSTRTVYLRWRPPYWRVTGKVTRLPQKKVCSSGWTRHRTLWRRMLGLLAGVPTYSWIAQSVHSNDDLPAVRNK